MQAAIVNQEAEASGALQYLTFVCAGEEYGVEILCVQEIKGWEGVTRVPYTPSYLLGVMNLRGVIVPVIDLRARFGLESRSAGSTPVVIVVRVNNTEGGEKTAGIVVDAVSEVYAVTPDDIRPTPDLGASRSLACVRGLTNVDNKMVMLLDIDQLVVSCLESPDGVGAG
jgi:purine-binding chemotaxis protein CheW